MKCLVRRAKLYEEMDKLDEALEDYKKIYELDPSNKEAFVATQVCIKIFRIIVVISTDIQFQF